jgi:hypothetical protein
MSAMSPAPLIGIGHSHIAAVTDAAKERQVPFVAFNFWVLGLPLDRRGSVVHLPAQILPQLSGDVFSFVGGGVHMDYGMIVHPRPYDVVLPNQPDLPLTPGAEIIPYDALYASMEVRTRPFLQIMAAVRAASQGLVFHMEAPPPREDEIAPAENPNWIIFYGENSVISPPWLRYKLWRMHSSIVRRYCDEADIAFVPSPREASDERGFLDPGYWAHPGHANRAYGALVLDQMQGLLRREVGDRAGAATALSTNADAAPEPER